MSAAEFDSWCEFYRSAPFDDVSRYHRPAAVIATYIGRTDAPISKAQELICPIWKTGSASSEQFSDLAEDDVALLRMFGIPVGG